MTQLQKVHGSMNTFFLLDQTELNQPLRQTELIDFARHITDDQQGLLGGADGLLVVDRSNHEECLGSMQVINTDGSIASMCGNGLRTVSRYLSEKFGQTKFKVETQDADLHVSQENNFADGVPTFSVEISPVSFNRESLPFSNLNTDTLIDQTVPEFDDTLKFTAIAVPNPHLISFVSEDVMDSDSLSKIGSELNSENQYFYDGVNVSYARIIDHNSLFVRTFERGVGFTNACGTGMSATSLAFCLNHPDMANFEQEITVTNPGGMVKTRVHQLSDSNYSIDLIGNATVTHTVTIDENDLHNNQLTSAQPAETGEQSAYEAFVATI
ncbi:diaminopimelate epimerase [Lentilactobacillus sp. SPB1-3]|uniref:Diaminopimelate epimerase n=1 Tax=Lentilactobacillus terminaliae TaxID=3003483 RepID=A0ACD5DF51_9LACO|nr:diaminopimelate epimerase [Lentilactobacillus sp. SPB1-3]MCZ0976542.1 diaminopimelate epimerase [Lentilactobacillus sp. SPB1-3]